MLTCGVIFFFFKLVFDVQYVLGCIDVIVLMNTGWISQNLKQVNEKLIKTDVY